MNHSDAAKILSLTGDITPDIVKQAYRVACKAFHPDRNPAGLEMMKAVNVAYATLKDVTETTENSDIEYSEKLNDAINAIINLEGLIVEVCGSWVWVSGDTRPHKTVIKEAGYFWASKKKMWYYRPADYKSSSRGKLSMDEVRNIHGSSTVKAKAQNKIK
jgi:hypothetical protein